MLKELCYNEGIINNEQQTLLPKNDNNLKLNLLTQSHKYRQIFQKEFQIKDYDNLTSGLIVYLEKINSKPSLEIHMQPLNTNDFYNLPPRLFISYLETLHLSSEEKKQILEGWLLYCLLKVRGLKIQEISLSEEKIHYLKKPNQLTPILKEIQELASFEDWDTFYRYAQNLLEITNLAQLDKFDKNLENQKQLLSQSLENQKKIFQRLKEISQKKRQSFSQSDNLLNQTNEVSLKNNELIERYKRHLTESLNYLDYADCKKSLIKYFPRKMLEMLNFYRNLFFTPTPETYRLAEVFWPSRLNRKIDLSRFPPLISKLTDRFFKANYDDDLLKEPGGFWLEKNINIPELSILLLNESKTSKQKAVGSIVESLTSLITSLPYFKNQSVININVNFDDHHIYKLKINTENPQSIHDQIKTQFNSNFQPVNIPQDKIQLFNIRKEAYENLNFKSKSKIFQELFGHKERVNFLGFSLPFFKSNVDELSIRINTNPKKNPPSNPASLFMVGNHHLLLNLDIHNNTIKMSCKFAHRHFDGIPAKKFFNTLTENLKSKFNAEELPLYATEENFYQDFLPVFEANARVVLSNVLAEPKGKFNPTLIYALAIAINNDINYFHFLVNGPDLFSKDGPYSNVQPAVISLLPIKSIIKNLKEGVILNDEEKKKISEWQNKTLDEIRRAKNGFSTPAVIAAPTGSKQKILSKLSEKIYQAIEILTQSQGMFSGIPDLKPIKIQRTGFYTAQSDSYHLDINLNQPKPSIGVIGFNQSQEQKDFTFESELVFTIRKNPSQAQKELKDWFDKNFGNNQNLLKKFEHLVKSWDQLVRGKNSIEKYFSTLKNFLDDLPDEKKAEISSKEEIQRKLNQILFESAQNTLSNFEQNIQLVENLLSYSSK